MTDFLRNDTIGYITDILRNGTIGYLTGIRICLNKKKYLFLVIDLFHYKVRLRSVAASERSSSSCLCYSSGFDVCLRAVEVGEFPTERL
jgi:hypothetical protein